MDERESIFGDLEDILEDVDGVELVSRDFRRVIVGSLSEYPAIFIVDNGDEVVEADISRGYRDIDYRRTMNVGIIAAYKGTSDDNAGAEIAAFLKKIKKQIYDHLDENEYISVFAEKGTSQLSYADSPKVVLQGVEFEILYVEQTNKLFS